MGRKNNRTPEKDKQFIGLIAGGSTVMDACHKVGYGYTQAYEYRKNDPVFDEEWNNADESATQRMEREADRRAIDGFDKPVFYEGVECGTIRQFSDTLLIFRLKAKRPEVYRERTELSGNLNITGGLADRLEAARKREKSGK